MKLIITAPRGKMASLIVADAAKRDDVEIIAGIGPKGRDYIGKDIGEVAMIGSSVGAPVVDDIESVIDDADVVCDFSTVELGMEVLNACIRHKKALVVGTTGFNPEQRAKLEAAANAVDSGTIKTEHDMLMEEYEVVTAVIRSVIPKSELNSEDDGVTEFSPSDDVMEFLPSSESDD